MCLLTFYYNDFDTHRCFSTTGLCYTFCINHLKMQKSKGHYSEVVVLIDFSLSVKAVTLIFISGRCSACSSAKQEKSGSIYNLVKN